MSYYIGVAIILIVFFLHLYRKKKRHQEYMRQMKMTDALYSNKEISAREFANIADVLARQDDKRMKEEKENPDPNDRVRPHF